MNIGGEKVVQRRRSTLCAVDGTFLAARFSGRWEQDVDRDAQGHYFINPELFLPLLNYLGMKETEHRAEDVQFPNVSAPEFGAMLRFLQ